ncbi:endoribonuclease Dcr-1 [Coccinella septempunctata]|uniref:endoribonuclease Dcr-1 n=1 Tax=Coccinella septempunctata TaxID=41139 RepID=UPI001D080655|nr:endoribonuclease Dcr-1 [Coccinella septempunctata]
MSYYANENFYSHTFTPREYQVELLESAKKRNTVVCSSTDSAKSFIILKLLQEFSWKMRNSSKKTFLLLDDENISLIGSQIRLITDLNVFSLVTENDVEEEEWNNALHVSEVVLMNENICRKLMMYDLMDLSKFELIIIDDCLYGERQIVIHELMDIYEKLEEKPRILGFSASLLGLDLQPEYLESELLRLEKLLDSTVDTSSEIVTLIRLSCRPKEYIVECALSIIVELDSLIRKEVINALNFLKEHRFDPSEIYEADLLDEIKQAPNPVDEPMNLLSILLSILTDMGPWCAQQAALTMVSKIEKLKIKVPYERHFLLLCMVSTVLVKIYSICENYMKDLSDTEKILKFSTSKVLRYLEILKKFKPKIEKTDAQEVIPEQGREIEVNARPRKGGRVPRRLFVQKNQTDDSICCLTFVHDRYRAKVLFNLLCVMSQNHEDYIWISTQYAVEKTADPAKEMKEAEMEHKQHEEVLRKYRAHEVNIMISTFVLEHGCDLPRCNLVVRFDLPEMFHSYIQSKARARASHAHFVSLVNEDNTMDFVGKLSQYNEIENILLKRCCSLEPEKEEEHYANSFSALCEPYQPLKQEGSPSVTLSNAVTLINKYCAKLPSDTFTKLTPIWGEEKIKEGYICRIRLPINSPVKETILSPPMYNSLLARRAAAFMACQLLHKTGELDDNLQPIGKENFVASEEDWNTFPLDEADEELARENVEPRPGTTKRRQYYYKKVADALLSCHPVAGERSYFYKIVMTLTCPLPEEQNTRGRKIYPPEDFPQSFGILTSKKIPKISSFPIFTRSGEVSVDLELCSSNIVLTTKQISQLREFLNYTFTRVLRLQKYLMLFNPDSSLNSYLVVPTNSNSINNTVIDWNFVELINENLTILPEIVPEEKRANYNFDPKKYEDAVVMPWYRNQDQPQYFYVAEICKNLSPKSSFPGSEYATFEEYYLKKYDIQIQNFSQHLLDVDHTSARLNFLTPRYVNRKGVALPTSSEETKRAKRENLEQKQILVPELCAIHPFPASLWRKAVCLPCILYRINALLLADQIRKTVAVELLLGTAELEEHFKWPALNFGWSLCDVIKKSKEDEAKQDEKPEEIEIEKAEIIEDFDVEIAEITDKIDDDKSSWNIGTWSNDMAGSNEDGELTIKYSSPTSWMVADDYDDYTSSESSYSDDDSNDDIGGCRIEFTGNYLAEAVDSEEVKEVVTSKQCVSVWSDINCSLKNVEELQQKFNEACIRNKKNILNSGMLLKKDQEFTKNEELHNTPKIHENGMVSNFDFNQLIVNPRKPIYSPKKFRKTRYNCDIIDSSTFKFDAQPSLENHPGPSPNLLLQALTMSNANDGINLERLETIGDSFLKYAITNYLYSKYENIHEGKLSHLRSKQVSNLNLYRLGKRKNLGEFMIATKFDPHDNWLPPCFYVPKELEEALLAAQYPANCWTMADMEATRDMTLEDICSMVKEKGEEIAFPNSIPYNLVTQHSIPDKSIADCVEALIGAYLIDCGPRGALLFMTWLGIKVLPQISDNTYGEFELPHSPLLRHLPNSQEELEVLLDGYNEFERHIGYKFKDRSYLLQALTHASYSPNRITDCYQRLEFLGDAVLDYLITRHLYEDSRMHSPGALTDLRSALVNNTIFASLAVRNGFHKYFRHLSPGLNEVIEKFIRLQEECGHSLVEELFLVIETDAEEVEDVEVPKALGDIFESVAGAIFLDSEMSLDAVWEVYHKMMQAEIEQFSNKVPKSPIRELLELEPETAKFGKPEKLADGRRVRVSVEVFGKGTFKGIGRNYRIAKCTAAKCALKHLKRQGLVRRNE